FVRSHQIQKGNRLTLFRALHFDLPCTPDSMVRKTLAGLPATIVLGGTFLVTTLPAPTMAFSPIVTFDRMVAPDPTEAPFLTTVASTFQSCSVCKVPSGLVARG